MTMILIQMKCAATAEEEITVIKRMILMETEVSDACVNYYDVTYHDYLRVYVIFGLH